MTPTPEEQAIIDDREAKRGDFRLCMIAFKKAIDARLTVILQQDINLPLSFGGHILADLKELREAFGYDPDNVPDSNNYRYQARKLDAEARNGNT